MTQYPPQTKIGINKPNSFLLHEVINACMKQASGMTTFLFFSLRIIMLRLQLNQMEDYSKES